jgi:hypothetical protein
MLRQIDGLAGATGTTGPGHRLTPATFLDFVTDHTTKEGDERLLAP